MSSDEAEFDDGYGEEDEAQDEDNEEDEDNVPLTELATGESGGPRSRRSAAALPQAASKELRMEEDDDDDDEDDDDDDQGDDEDYDENAEGGGGNDEDEELEDAEAEDDDDDDLPLIHLKSQDKKKKASASAKKKASPASKKKPATKKAAPAKKTKTAGKKKAPAASSKKKTASSSEPASSSSTLITASSELYAKSDKGRLIQSLLCRWWYAIEWPDPSTLPRPEDVPDEYDALDGFPGVYVCTSGDEVGKIKDYRDVSESPNFQNFARKPSEELQRHLMQAIDKQREALIEAEGRGSETQKELDKLQTWVKKVNGDKADRQAEKILKAARLTIPSS